MMLQFNYITMDDQALQQNWQSASFVYLIWLKKSPYHDTGSFLRT